MSKFDYFLQQRDEARRIFQEPCSAFADCSDLLQELRVVFDWMAQERGSMKISSRKFKQQLPEIHKKFPLLASNFERMDANGDCWLEWTEFADFCLQDDRLRKAMKRMTSVSAYGVDYSGKWAYKDHHDSHHGCEISLSPPMLPWEKMHVVEWRIEGLSYNGCQKGLPVLNFGSPVTPGTYLSSPPFRAAGVSGFLRFWPAGYWTEAQQRKKSSQPGCPQEKEVDDGLVAWPGPRTWSCLGVCLPPGSNLELRFFVGGNRSDVRSCYWSKGVNAAQLWAPRGQWAPPEVVGLGPQEPLTVGIEILRNKGVLHRKPVVSKIHPRSRHDTRPALKPVGFVSLPKQSKLLSSWSSQPKMVEARPATSPATCSMPDLRASLPNRPASAAEGLRRSHSANHWLAEVT